MRTRELLTKKKLKNYLKKQDKNWEAEPQNSGSCPIARYLEDVTENYHINVGTDEIQRSYNGLNGDEVEVVTRNIPKWAVKYINKVDEITASTLNRNKALAILEEV